ncbi:MAG TPA: nucleoside kinase [Clostridia bacterium]|nr:nucleoside kinase [Clostridia bacterium]
MTNSKDKIKVNVEPGNTVYIDKGTPLKSLVADYADRYKTPVIAAKVDNDIRELSYRLKGDCSVRFMDLTDEDGMRIYRRSLYFILMKAVYDLFPDRRVIISHAISKGLFCEIRGEKALEPSEVKLIEDRMHEIVAEAIPFKKREIPLPEAEALFESTGRMDRYHTVEHRNKKLVTIYNCDGLDDYFYGYMAPDTGYIKVFGLRYHEGGLIVSFPDKSSPYELPPYEEQNKLFNVYLEFKKWGRILEVENVGALNDLIKAGKSTEIIRISEALHEKKLASIADTITNSGKKRIVLISGPSSSGKTTFAQRLSIQLRVNGLKPVTISLDDYFVNREDTPKDEFGDYDFEALEAIDVKLFNRQLRELIEGYEVELPLFNFTTGSREPVGRKMKINDDNILVIEGIHGLNERLTSEIPREQKFKIYVSALTSMNIDDHNRIPTTDNRIIRRIVRDHQFRGSSALNTIKRWPSVRRGEGKNIFPFQEGADVMFNSALMYELSVLKTFAEPLLNEVNNTEEEYSEANRLLEFLSYFLPIDPKDVPANSIIREFLGGSCFY